MSEKRFTLEQWTKHSLYYSDGEYSAHMSIGFICEKVEKKLNEQQELIEELQASDEMGWKRAEHFEKKCPKELHNKKMYIKRLEYKVQKFKEENEQLRLELETHKHPLWSTREAEKKVNKLADSLANEVKKNGLLNEEINQLRIENMRLKKRW